MQIIPKLIFPSPFNVDYRMTHLSKMLGYNIERWWIRGVPKFVTIIGT
jgi:hypothetical protein